MVEGVFDLDGFVYEGPFIEPGADALRWASIVREVAPEQGVDEDIIARFHILRSPEGKWAPILIPADEPAMLRYYARNGYPINDGFARVKLLGYVEGHNSDPREWARRILPAWATSKIMISRLRERREKKMADEIRKAGVTRERTKWVAKKYGTDVATAAHSLGALHERE